MNLESFLVRLALDPTVKKVSMGEESFRDLGLGDDKFIECLGPNGPVRVEKDPTLPILCIRVHRAEDERISKLERELNKDMRAFEAKDAEIAKLKAVVKFLIQ